jgi:major vault protein
MAEENRNERDLVLAPNEFALVSDATKGSIDCYVGPFKTSLAGTDRCVVFDSKTKRFRPVSMTEGVQLVQTAPEGFYIILKNVAADDKHPSGTGKMTTPTLLVGKKVIIPGPVSFALWPGQMAKVLPGHTLRSNQYLLVRVYDDEAARENWKNSVIKAAKKDGAEANQDKLLSEMPKLTMGKLLVIRGTDVSFYIPPTGIEVVPDEYGKLVRDAVTLERLEYCLLLDENGNKRYVQGPDVVFPEPTEVFVTRTIQKQGETPRESRKFKAIELSETSGLYIKVIAEYEDGYRHPVGEELFITGKTQTIYFPREEHAIIKYGDQDVHYATAIPAGEARYVLNRLSGEVRLAIGPVMFLPDPRTEVIARRVLDLKLCALLYPGNDEALAYNAALAGIELKPEEKTRGAILYAASNMAPSAAALYSGGLVGASVSNSPEARGLGGIAATEFTGDRFQRKGTYTEPRTITLNTKYDGVVSTDLWTGYAMMLVRKSGERRVVQGPKTVMLEYDESPQVLELSSGKPKTTDHLYRTVFLRTVANKVGDIIEAETSDFCKVKVKVSYRVNFEGDPVKWFDVENYVKFLCDHIRSRIRTQVRKLGIEQFYLDSETMIRDVVLGKAKEEGKRPGTSFAENGMRIYDVEVLGVEMNNPDVEKLFIGAQRDSITHTISLQTAERALEFTKKNEKIQQEKAAAEAETREAKIELQKSELDAKLKLDLATLVAAAQTQASRIVNDQEKEKGVSALEAEVRERTRLKAEQQLAVERGQLEIRLAELTAEVRAVVDRATAVSPDLVAALNTFGERALIERVAESMGPLAIIGGAKKSVTQILADLLKETPFAKQLTNGVGDKLKTPQPQV